MTVTTTNPGTGTARVISTWSPEHWSRPEPHRHRVSATDGTATDTKSLTITVTGVKSCSGVGRSLQRDGEQKAQRPIIRFRQRIRDGQALTFAKVSGPTYATVTTTTPWDGNGYGECSALRQGSRIQ